MCFNAFSNSWVSFADEENDCVDFVFTVGNSTSLGSGSPQGHNGWHPISGQIVSGASQTSRSHLPKGNALYQMPQMAPLYDTGVAHDLDMQPHSSRWGLNEDSCTRAGASPPTAAVPQQQHCDLEEHRPSSDQVRLAQHDGRHRLL